MRKPIYIVFEGIDGSGKTTQAQRLCSSLNDIGIPTLYKHVFDSNTGRIIRRVFLENSFLSNTVEVMLLCAARQAFIDDMAQVADKYSVIIVDRFYLSIFAMQGTNQRDISLINYIRNNICDLPDPVYHLYICVDPYECQRRISSRKQSMDRIEQLDIWFHSRVMERYSELLRQEKNVIRIDGNHSVDTVHEAIKTKIKPILLELAGVNI